MSKNPVEQIAIYREANRQAAAVIMTARQRYPRMQIWADRVLNPKPNETFLGRNGLAIPEAEITLASTIDVTADHRDRNRMDSRRRYIGRWSPRKEIREIS
jgi:hypothetical protein